MELARAVTSSETPAYVAVTDSTGAVIVVVKLAARVSILSWKVAHKENAIECPFPRLVIYM